MDTTTRIIAQAKIANDATTGLERFAQVTSLNINGENNGLITAKGRIVLLSSTGVAMHIESNWEFVRHDRAAIYGDVKVVDTPATYYTIGEDMGGGVLAETGLEIKTPEVSHYESQVVSAANNKYTMLEQSAIGQGIKQMLGLDLSGAIVNGLWVEGNLRQL